MEFISVPAQRWRYLWVNAAPFLSVGLICKRYTSNSDVTQITRVFSFSLALSKSILSNVAEPFGLSVLRDANYMWREKTERWRETRTGKKNTDTDVEIQ